MPNRSVVLSVLVGTVLAPVSTRTEAQIVLQLDQTTHNVRIASPNDARRLVDSGESGAFRLRHPARVQVQVVNTNTAVYQITTEEKETPPPAAFQSIRQFLPLMKPYLPELAFMVPRGARTRGETEPRTSMLPSTPPTSDPEAQIALYAAQLVERDLRELDSLVHGPRGIDGALGLTLRTLGRMRPGQVEAQAKALTDSLGLPEQSCRDETSSPARSRVAQQSSLGLSNHILEKLNALQPHSVALATVLSDTIFAQDPALRSFRSQVSPLQVRADTALHDSDALVTAAYRVEQMAATIAGACSHWESPPLSVSAGAGRIVTVKIEPRPEPEIQRAADQKASSVSITLLPPPKVLDASLGLSVLVAPRAQYSTYGVRPVGGAGSANEVYEASTVDDRFSYGVTLGLRWHPRVDWPGTSPLALWFPNLTVAEAGSQHAVGLGGAISFGPLTIGGGMLSVQHQILDSLSVGQHVPNDKFLKTINTYRHPIPYIAVTVFDLADFLSGGGGGGGSGEGGARPPASETGKSPKK